MRWRCRRKRTIRRDREREADASGVGLEQKAAIRTAL